MSERSGLPRIPRTLDRKGRRADCSREMHRAGVIRDQEIARLEPGGKKEEVGPAGQVEGDPTRDLRGELALPGTAENDDPYALPRQPPHDGGKSIRIPSPG